MLLEDSPEVVVATQANTADPKAEAIIQRQSKRPEFQGLLRACLKASPDYDLEFIEKAYLFAELAHRDRVRGPGDPHIHHTLSVARELLELNQDSSTVAAGLLHDVLDTAHVPLSQVHAEFGEEIAALVDGVSRIRDLAFQTPEAEQAENFRRMMLSIAQDIRVVLIKFADRLDTMRDLEHSDPETRNAMSLESRDIYAPLAHRFGMARIRWELEDLALKWLEPDAYREIQEKVDLRREEREDYIEQVRKPLQQALEQAGIYADIQGRAKNFYSVYGKIVRRGKSIEEIYDLLAIRIVVNTVPACYHALGLIHSMYTPVMARFKDFIATPKSNMYQSLHTTVIGPKGIMLEVQIRTWKMHQTAEVGIAAHWRYKDETGNSSDMDRYLAWLRSLLEWQRDTTDPREFIEELKIDLFPNEIYVFTPNGDLIQLPEGSTPVDFAFAVHTDVGIHCTGARVNGHMVSISTPLETGNTVEVITSPHQRPSRDWLSFVKSAKARSRIRRWLKVEEHAQSVRLGQEILERELKRRRERVKDEALEGIASELGFADAEHLYAGIGNGDISVVKICHRLFPSTAGALKKLRMEPSRRRKKSTLKVHGLTNMMMHFARCCGPIPGDSILGVITRGQGVSVHRRDCKNIRNLSEDRDRILDLEWDMGLEETFPVRIEVFGMDRPNFLRDVTQAMSDAGVHVSGGDLRTVDGQVGDRFEVEVQSTEQLSQLLRRVRAVEGVTLVQRMDVAP